VQHRHDGEQVVVQDGKHVVAIRTSTGNISIYLRPAKIGTVIYACEIIDL